MHHVAYMALREKIFLHCREKVLPALSLLPKPTGTYKWAPEQSQAEEVDLVTDPSFSSLSEK